MDEQFVQEIVALARQIAEYHGETVSRLAARMRFPGRLEAIYEAYCAVYPPETDVYALAVNALADAAVCWSDGDEWPYWHLVALLHYFDLDTAKTEAATLAVYRYRAVEPDNQGFAVECKLIGAALEKFS